ncbi:hypothetical protein BIFANG_03317 [Bifidobacterium angulatum DSM 20098 = JCM 7096]|uniref:Uncharacterized protein n=1 Tax=Bifidobacterium angulatum DSM 20098 = JCM 7096 TaxID=518635 RepID=C4FG51_9BIFI|nr:hypothetical protein BIFANG_03317 [Bifidobacterium angulatum DSM 20098 = JCM 7096]
MRLGIRSGVHIDGALIKRPMPQMRHPSERRRFMHGFCYTCE